MSDSRAFFYVDGVPTKGCWVDIDSTTDMDDVCTALAAAGVFDEGISPDDDRDEGRKTMAEQYDGDILVADAEGLAGEFLGSNGKFDLEELVCWLSFIDDRRYDEDAVVAYVSGFGTQYATTSGFEDCYCGTFDTSADWAAEAINDTYSVPKGLENYIDYDSFVRDCEQGGEYVFADTHHGQVAVFLNK